MHKTTIRIAIISLVLPLFAACGGGGGGGSGSSDPDHPLTGDWTGTFDQLKDAAGFVTASLSFNSDGKLTSATVDGSKLGITAKPINTEDGFFTYEQNNGAIIVFRKMESNSLAYVDGGDAVGLFGKGIDSLPNYSLQDTNGTLDGREFVVDAAYNIQDTVTFSGTIEGNNTPLTFTFSDDFGCNSSGTLNLASTTNGVYTGTFSNNSGTNCLQSGSVKHYLSPNKNAALTIGCESFNSFDVPQNCAFLFGVKQ